LETSIKYSEHSITNPSIKDLVDIKDIDNLQPIYNHIYIGDLINFLNLEDLFPILSKIKTKLLPSAILSIEEFDAFELCSALVNGQIKSADFNNIIRPRQHLLTINDIYDVLTKLNMKIISKDIDCFKHYIEAQNG
jgi:hypothetical protein